VFRSGFGLEIVLVLLSLDCFPSLGDCGTLAHRKGQSLPNFIPCMGAHHKES